ncbi:MAG: PKD domain-containing protein [Ferruginibacter sp.]
MNKFIFVFFSFSFLLNANSQTVDFSFESANGLYCNPTTILFKQTCTGNPISFIWSFGNNLYSDKPVDSTFYTIAGSYTVKLIAIFETATLEISKVVLINPKVSASIGFDKNNLCQPGSINFTGPTGGGIKNYEWNFGDGTAIVNASSNGTSHSYANFGTNNVTLKITATSGCYDTASTIVTIKRLESTGAVPQFRGCIPFVVNFTGDVTLPSNSSVVNYTWDFGDGSPPYISTVNTATHTYSFVGDYFPGFTVITSEGCTSTYSFKRLYFGTAPTDNVGYAQTNPVCGSDSVVFISKATNANRYFWQFGDGTNASTTDTIIKHKYNTIGNKNVQVKPYYNECDAPTYRIPISIIGVIAKYALSNTCSNKNIYSFGDTSSGIPTSTLWNFGNGIQQANIIDPVHSFPISGEFKTTLYTADSVSGCSDSSSRMIYTAVPEIYSADSSVCKNKAISFSILNNYTDTSAMYTWIVVGSQTGPAGNDSIAIDADKFGSFNNFVVIDRGLENCPDTIILNRPITVKGPNLDFTAPNLICLNNLLTVTNNSQPFIAADSVKRWYWNFGNSITNDTAFQPAPFQYTTPGTYNVKLTALDKNGCEDTLTKAILINPAPFLHITAARDKVCYGQSVTMFAFHNNDLLWSPANSISCTTCDTTIATPIVSTRYYGTATNSFNCSVRDSNYIEVENPFTTTIVPTDNYICQNENTTVDVNPKGKKILWSPVAGLSNATIYNPVIAASQSTTYSATLTDSAGCLFSSSATVNVHVKSLPFVDAGPDKYYSKGTGYTFTPTYGNNVNSYLWTPSVLLSCDNCAIPSGVATYTQRYLLRVTSDSGCVASDSVTIGVDCISSNIFMPKAFTPNNDNLNDLFYPITAGIKSILKFTIYNRQGRVLYEARNFSPNDKLYGWNGKFKGANQIMDTYVYTMETVCETGEKIFKKGSFILMR